MSPLDPDALDLAELAMSYQEADPDPGNWAEVDDLLKGDVEVLRHRFVERLQFGTAGLRGAMGAGPNRMNAVVVAQTARAIGKWLPGDSSVIIGFDARHGSRAFAHVSAQVIKAAGHSVMLLPEPTPTPVIAHAASARRATAAIVVTASHNPATDNGYKVYAADGAQIGAEHARQIEGHIDPFDLDLPSQENLVEPVPAAEFDDLLSNYLASIDHGAVGRGLHVAYTPLHGVGADLAQRAMERAGHTVTTVAEQAEPDPDFPTTPFPNPEESGTLDLLLALAEDCGADIALAHDPDADRLAAAVPTARGWRRLTGDDIGALLCEHLLSQPTSDDQKTRLVASTIVSSSLVPKIAAHHGAVHVMTSTGFKHLARAGDARPDADFVFAYEEALGYSVVPSIRDKDGISAALSLLQSAASAAAEGGTLVDLLDRIHARHGVHLNGQVSHRFGTLDPMGDMNRVVQEMIDNPPPTIAGISTERYEVVDGVVLIHLRVDPTTSGRIAVRPSGTEPKLKFYLEAVADDHSAAAELLKRLHRAAAEEFGA